MSSVLTSVLACVRARVLATDWARVLATDWASGIDENTGPNHWVSVLASALKAVMSTTLASIWASRLTSTSHAPIGLTGFAALKISGLDLRRSFGGFHLFLFLFDFVNCLLAFDHFLRPTSRGFTVWPHFHQILNRFGRSSDLLSRREPRLLSSSLATQNERPQFGLQTGNEDERGEQLMHRDQQLLVHGTGKDFLFNGVEVGRHPVIEVLGALPSSELKSLQHLEALRQREAAAELQLQLGLEQLPISLHLGAFVGQVSEPSPALAGHGLGSILGRFGVSPLVLLGPVLHCEDEPLDRKAVDLAAEGRNLEYAAGRYGRTAAEPLQHLVLKWATSSFNFL